MIRYRNQQYFTKASYACLMSCAVVDRVGILQELDCYPIRFRFLPFHRLWNVAFFSPHQISIFPPFYFVELSKEDLIKLREVSDANWKLEFSFIGLLTHLGRRLSSPINE